MSFALMKNLGKQAYNNWEQIVTNQAKLKNAYIAKEKIQPITNKHHLTKRGRAKVFQN